MLNLEDALSLQSLQYLSKCDPSQVLATGAGDNSIMLWDLNTKPRFVGAWAHLYIFTIHIYIYCRSLLRISYPNCRVRGRVGMRVCVQRV